MKFVSCANIIPPTLTPNLTLDLMWLVNYYLCLARTGLRME